MMQNILVIEDDKDVRDVLRYSLEKEKYRVYLSEDGLAGFEAAVKIVPDLILLDLVLPKLNGIEVCRMLKSDARLWKTPVILLTVKHEEEDKIRGFENGADDYVTKPFSPRELIARVKARLRDSLLKVAEDQFQYEKVSIDILKHEVFYNGKEVELTPKEFELLLYLVQNKGRVLTRDMILNRVWGYSYSGTSRTVDVHITHLRQKILILAERLSTVKPLGYKLKEPQPAESV